MNVVEPRLLPQEYPRANYLKREVQHARDYQHLHPTSAGAGALDTYFAEAASAGPNFVVTDGADYPVEGGGTIIVAVTDGVATFTYSP